MTGPSMIRECMMCGRVIGRIPCAPEQDGKITSGVCTRCGLIEFLRIGIEEVDLAPLEVERIENV